MLTSKLIRIAQTLFLSYILNFIKYKAVTILQYLCICTCVHYLSFFSQIAVCDACSSSKTKMHLDNRPDPKSVIFRMKSNSIGNLHQGHWSWKHARVQVFFN